ncbi:MAG: thioredoxin family protein [Candidatus Kapaibacterium sp.]
MKKLAMIALAAIAFISIKLIAAEAEIGKEAPGFTLTDSKGNTHSLSDFKGKYVVLEWVNFDCPFVKKHYDTDNMQNLQHKYTYKDVVWLMINSSANGKQGNFSPDEINKRMKDLEVKATAYLIDESGKTGRLYGAKTTPHMFIIDPDGKLIYAGGIDDKASTDNADVKGATNYVDAALQDAMNGRTVSVKTAKPYGCSVKY